MLIEFSVDTLNTMHLGVTANRPHCLKGSLRRNQTLKVGFFFPPEYYYSSTYLTAQSIPQRRNMEYLNSGFTLHFKEYISKPTRGYCINCKSKCGRNSRNHLVTGKLKSIGGKPILRNKGNAHLSWQCTKYNFWDLLHQLVEEVLCVSSASLFSSFFQHDYFN